MRTCVWVHHLLKSHSLCSNIRRCKFVHDNVYCKFRLKSHIAFTWWFLRLWAFKSPLSFSRSTYLHLKLRTWLALEGSEHCLHFLILWNSSLLAWWMHLRILWNSSFFAWWMRVGLGMPVFTVEGSMSIVLSMRLRPLWSNHVLEIVRQGTWASMCLTRLSFRYLLTFSVGLPQLQLHCSWSQNSNTHVVGDSLTMNSAAILDF